MTRFDRRHTLVAATCVAAALAGCAGQGPKPAATAQLDGLRTAQLSGLPTAQAHTLLSLISTAGADAKRGDVAGVSTALERFRTEVDALRSKRAISDQLASWLTTQAAAAETQADSVISTHAAGAKRVLASMHRRVRHATTTASPAGTAPTAAAASPTAASPAVTSEFAAASEHASESVAPARGGIRLGGTRLHRAERSNRSTDPRPRHARHGHSEPGRRQEPIGGKPGQGRRTDPRSASGAHRAPPGGRWSAGHDR